jgi:hypothetical protein
MKLGFGKLAITTLIGLSLAAGPALADALDTPIVSPAGAKPSTVRLTVQATDTGAPAGFTAEWIKKTQYDALGGWPTDGAGVSTANFVGTPVWTTEGTGDYTLNAGEWMDIELGQLFDETGVQATDSNEMQPGTEYVVRVRARAAGGSGASEPTADFVVSTLTAAENCTFTIGYWKTHPGAWPAASLTLGTVNYTAAELLSILNEPSGGNGLIILAHQLIAAKLNIINGANPAAAAAAIASADAQIGGLVVPPIGAGFLSPASVSTDAHTLDDFNNGIIGPGHCAETPARPTTWGSLKSTYHK